MKKLLLLFKPFGLVAETNSSSMANSQLRRHIDVVNYMIELNFTKNSRILDLGCGIGLLAKRLKEAGFTNITGADWLERDKVEYINSLDNYIQIDLNELDENLQKKFKNEIYDVVISSDVMEHLKNPSSFFRNINSITDSNSEIIISIPNAFNLIQRLFILFTGNSTRYKVEKKNEFGHITLVTSNIMQSLLNRIDLKVVDKKGGGMFLGGLSFLPKKSLSIKYSYSIIYRIKRKIL
jgi:2-polyprenyl-3-methyl-5-hydroxy-6-metoxy-1,4-benzoquinol methylase